MTFRVAIPSAGEMGAGLVAVLVSNRVQVLTATAGRSDRTRCRAAEAGLQEVDEPELACVDIVLSIVPPGIACETAQRLSRHFARLASPPLYIDCNAIDPSNARMVADIVEEAGALFVDGAIIGPPPSAALGVPRLYLSGDAAGRAIRLADHGLTVRIIDGGIGAASALKMSYGGLTKGLTGITAALILAAERHGVGDVLGAELADSQAALLKRSALVLPDMLPKAYRWVAEMEAVARFIGGHEEQVIWHGLAGLYARIAADLDGEGAEVATLRRFLQRSAKIEN
jgi:L-threonate 2-dehydrogenase